MSKKRRPMPEKIMVMGMQHRLTVFQIISKDGDGIPLECEMIRDRKTVGIEGGEEFMIAYIPVQMHRP